MVACNLEISCRYFIVWFMLGSSTGYMQRIKPKILVVDDDDEALITFKKSLNDGFRIQTASNGREGLRLIKEDSSIPLVIFDLIMPVMNGIEMLKELRGEGSQIYAMVVTGKSSHECAITCADLGVQGYMIKPIEPVQLVKRVKRLFNIGDVDYLRLLLGEEFKEKRKTLPSVVTKAIDYIWKNHESYYIREEVMTQVNVTGDHLCRVMKRDCGLGLNECINIIRVQESKQLISRDPEKRIKDVAVSVGINDVNYFCKLFKKHTSLTPGKFRENISS